MKIAVLLASYNGTKFIEEQLKSLFDQTYKDFAVFISDDGSNDDTLIKEQKFAENYPDRLFVYSRSSEKRGAKNNFLDLCKMALETDADYFMFCDQDDVWFPDKIRLTVNEMQKLEGDNIPVLIHTDLSVVDSKLRTIDKSFVKYRGIDPHCIMLNRLLIQNNVTGCTSMLNRALLEKGMQFKDTEKLIMHDWWFALVACLFGKIRFIDIPTVKYRQYGGNVVGASKVNSISFIRKRLGNPDFVKKSLKLPSLQAEALLDTYGNELDPKSLATITAMAELPKKKKLGRICGVLRHRLYKQGMVQIIGELLYI